MKSCPVCGAGSFDDAEVCYGCLYRYGEERGHDISSIASTSHPTSVRRQTGPVPMPVSMSAPAACAKAASTASSVITQAPVSASVVSLATVPSIPENVEWVVRFELPGDVSVSCSAASTATLADREWTAASERSDVKLCDDVRCKKFMRSFTIRFQPQGACGADNQRRVAGMYGNHACSVVNVDHPAAAVQRQ